MKVSLRAVAPAAVGRACSPALLREAVQAPSNRGAAKGATDDFFNAARGYRKYKNVFRSEKHRAAFTAIIRKEEDMYVADCPETGTVSQGKSVEEALKNLKEATELYLEEFPAGTTTRPLVTSFEVSGSENT